MRVRAAYTRCVLGIRSLLVTLPSILLVGGSAAAGTSVDSSNSILFSFFASTTEEVSGTDCGVVATFTRRLPAGAIGIKVVKPRVGDRDQPGRGTRVSAVNVTGTKVRVSVIADGPSICDPAQSGVPAGEPAEWTATYPLRAEYKRRVQATIRVFYESYIHGARWQMRPKSISDSRRGWQTAEHVTGIKWTSFGGRTAVGYGKLRLDYCRPGDNCPTNGKRIRLVASKPAYCKDSGKIEYLRLAGYLGKRELFGGIIECSP